MGVEAASFFMAKGIGAVHTSKLPAIYQLTGRPWTPQ